MISEPRRPSRWFLATLAAAALALAACGGTGDQPTASAPAAPDPEQQARPSRQSQAGADQQQAEPPASPSRQQQAQADPPGEPQSEPGSSGEREEPSEPEESEESGEPAEPEETIAAGTRIITLFGDLTEVVYALGAQEFLVARDTASIYPPEAEELPNLGFNQALSAEGVLAFEPTIIFATPAAGPEQALEHLRGAGVEVMIIDEDDDLDAPAAKIRLVGSALGIPRRAEALAVDVERRIAGVRGSIDESDRGPEVLFLYLRGTVFQFAGGADSPSQVMIEAAGGIDSGAAAGIVGFQPLTPEAVVAADPEVLLLMEGGIDSVGGIEGLLRIPGIAETRAGRDRRFIIMDDLYLLSFGPRAPDALAELAAELRRLRLEIAGG